MMTLHYRLKLHVLVHQIVSLRIDYGNYEDTGTIRNKLAAQTLKSIQKRKELESTGELEQAQKLHDLYEERVNCRPTSYPMIASKPPARIVLPV